jgi:two-component system sensor histidine kinase YesM
LKFPKTLRVKLSILYLLTTVIPLAIIVFVMPSYYQNVITRDSQTLTAATLTALSRNIDTYLDDLNRLTLTPYLNNDVMNALKLKASHEYASARPSEQLAANQALYTTLPYYLSTTRQDILSTIILPFDGSVFVAGKYSFSSPVPNYPFKQQTWYKQALAADGDVAFINPHPQDYLLTPLSTQVFSVARLIKDPDFVNGVSRPLAVIMADADTVVLRNIVNGVRLNVSSIIAVFGTNEQLLYSSQPLSGRVVQALARKEPVIQESGDAYLPVIKKTASAPWSVVILLSQSEITAQLQWLDIVGALFALLGLCLTFLLFSILSRWIVTPFQHMMGVMKQVQEGDLQTQVVIEGEDEIALLGNAFNTMITRLDETIGREYVATLNQRNAEYRALQSQIQPHFLYNTLNGFIGLNRLGERQTLENAIIALSGLLRHVLSSEEWVTIKEEFLFLQRYCELQALRFQEKMSFELHCEQALTDFKIPKLLLQPLVENAVIHGIEPADHPCLLRVYATTVLVGKEEKPVIRILVEDNGVGFALEAQGFNPHLGLANVRERLKLAYEGASLSINNAIGSGTRVVIEIPEP